VRSCAWLPQPSPRHPAPGSQQFRRSPS
jgi:hypothetical protein